MKSFLTCLLVALTLSLVAKDNEIDLQSTITDVVVYQQGAQVERQSRATIPAGTSILRFTELHPGIDPNQIRFNGTGDFSILAMYYDYQVDTISGQESQRIRVKLQEERAVIQHQINVENSFLDIYNRELNMLQSNQQFGSKDDGVKVADLIEAATFLRERFTDIREQQLAIEEKVKNLQAEIYRIDAKMSMLPPLQTESTLEYLVRVQAAKQTSARLSLRYQVQGAGWFPSYDARVESVAEPLELEYKANVYQNTGEDWENVNLTVATGNPNLNKKKQNLIPWYVTGNTPQYKQQVAANPNQYLQSQAYNVDIRQVRGQVMDDNGEPLIGANVQVHGHAVGATTDVNGYFTLDIPERGQYLTWSYIGHQTVQMVISAPVMNVVLKDQTAQLSAVTIQSYRQEEIQMVPPQMTLDVALAEEETLSDSYSRMRSLDGYTSNTTAPNTGAIYFASPPVANHASVTVSHSPTQTKFKIDTSYDIPSDGRQYAVTIRELDLDAEYLYAVTPKLDPTAFLTARLTDWQEYDLLTGQMNIYFEDTYVGQNQLDMGQLSDTLSLSLGPDPNIVVERKRLNQKSSASFIGSKRKDVREFEITVRNAKKEAIDIVVDDQLPLTHNEDIEVERVSLDGAHQDELTGRLSWELTVKPGKSERLTFKYALRYPKNMLLALGR